MDEQQPAAPKQQPETNEAGAGLASRRRLLGGAAGGLAALSATALAASFSTGTANAQVGGELRGTWTAVFTRDNPPPGFVPVQFLATFGPVGDVVGVGPSILFENGVPGLLGTFTGQWQETGPGTFSFRCTTTSVAQDGTFNYYLTNHIDMTMASDNRSWSGTYTRQDLAADGAMLRSLTGTIVGQPLAGSI